MTFKDWTSYFSANASRYDNFDWKDEPPVSPAEKKIIAQSIQKFQHGEYSEGRNLMKNARDWQHQDYVKTITLFIREEQRHAMVLGEWLDRNEIPRMKGDWVERVFRWLRSLAKLELSITVLVTAEFVATVYYDALRKATGSDNLKRICDNILEEEEKHITFQAETMRCFHRKRHWLFNKCVRYSHWILMAGTSVMVWIGHKRVFKAGGYTFKSYQRALWKEFFRAEAIIAKPVATVPVGS